MHSPRVLGNLVKTSVTSSFMKGGGEYVPYRIAVRIKRIKCMQSTVSGMYPVNVSYITNVCSIAPKFKLYIHILPFEFISRYKTEQTCLFLTLNFLFCIRV